MIPKSSNLGIDYVISFRFAAADKKKAEAQFEQLVSALDKVGLRVEARDGRNGSVLVFVRIKSHSKFRAEVYRSRVKDWLHGVRPAAPELETQSSLDKEPVTDAERLRLVYQLITLPKEEGGAGITVGQGNWDLVESIFPLHDRAFNKDWLKRWSTTWTIKDADLTLLRDKFGEKVGFYFAFLQEYFKFLLFPAIFGATSFFFLPAYSPLFALANGLWSIIFVEWWRKQEVDLAVRWGVRGCAKIQTKRAAFKADGIVEDAITGERVPVFSSWKRLARQSLQIPFALLACGLLATFIAGVFGIEILIVEVYNGPGKNVLSFLPTVLLSIFVPTLSAILTNIATRLNRYENYENADSYDHAMIQKIFVLNFITSYLPLVLTAFVYVPFGSWIVPKLDIFSLVTIPGIEEKHAVMPSSFEINPSRLKKQVIYFTVTAQVVGLALELIVPVVKRKVFKTAKKIQGERKDPNAVIDKADERAFLERVRDEAELDVYSVSSDLREMTMQFGYLTLFSPVWPLTAVSFIINNFVELRSDAAKICAEMQRPVPLRADSIGPWLDNLSLLSWLGSLSSAALLYIFGGDAAEGIPKTLTLWGILVALLVSEHLYFAARMVVRAAISKIDSPGLIHERRERYLVRKRFLEESFGREELEKRQSGAVGVSSSAVELEGIAKDEHEKKFWSAQRSSEDTAAAGKSIITRSVTKKVQ